MQSKAGSRAQELQQRCAELEAATAAADAAHAAAEAAREEKVTALRARCQSMAARIVELETALAKTTADRSTDVVRARLLQGLPTHKGFSMAPWLQLTATSNETSCEEY